MSDEEEYDFSYESNDEDEPEANLENDYEDAKGLRDDGKPKAAITAFAKIAAEENPKGIWGFKSLKMTLKTMCKVQKNYAAMMPIFKTLLTYAKIITPRDWDKALTAILGYVSGANEVCFILFFGCKKESLEYLKYIL